MSALENDAPSSVPDMKQAFTITSCGLVPTAIFINLGNLIVRTCDSFVDK